MLLFTLGRIDVVDLDAPPKCESASRSGTSRARRRLHAKHFDDGAVVSGRCVQTIVNDRLRDFFRGHSWGHAAAFEHAGGGRTGENSDGGDAAAGELFGEAFDEPLVPRSTCTKSGYRYAAWCDVSRQA